MKWKGFQRDQVVLAQEPPLETFGNPVPLTEDLTTAPHLTGFAGLDDLLRAPSDTPLLAPRPLLISKDIEALLEEDERKRSQETTELVRYPSEFDSSFDSVPGPIIGLPAPPRGPRKTVQRERGQRSRVQDGRLNGRRTPQTVSEDLIPSGETAETLYGTQGPSTPDIPIPVILSSQPPTIQDVPIESTLSLSIEVMDALSTHQARGAGDSPNSLSSARMLPMDQQSMSYMSSAWDGQKSSAQQFQVRKDTSSNLNSQDETGLRETVGRPLFAEFLFSPTDSADSSSPGLLEISKVGAVAKQTSRPLLCHAPSNSRDSDFSHSSFSSHEPPSTVHEPRISISSTIYPSSACDSLPPPPVPIRTYDLSEDPRSSLSYIERDSITFEDQPRTGSINDLASPTSPGHETLPPPQFANPDEISSSDCSPIDFPGGASPHLHAFVSSSVMTRHISSSSKPSLPTTPKPNFRRSRSAQPSSKTAKALKPPSPSPTPKFSSLIPYNLLTSLTNSDDVPVDPLPPTTNHLNPQERADLVRKTRKLTQVLGHTPSPRSGTEELLDSPVAYNCLLPMIPSRKAHSRGALSVSDALQVASAVKGIRENRSSPLSPTYGWKSASPLSPITFRSSYFAPEDDLDDSPSPFDSPAAQTPRSSRRRDEDGSSRSPAIISAADSFIELADPEPHGLPHSLDACSLADTISDSEKVEEERRRKRETLAKLHRFLGSRIPAELILGPHEMGVPLPALRTVDSGPNPAPSDEETSSPARRWIRGRRRNSLASSLPTHWLADSERIKEDLNDKEKAINVKRALKMEKMFGEQPPQNLFHTRQSVSVGHATGKVSEYSSSAPSSPVGTNINKSAYRKSKYLKRNERPGTAESRKGLLGGDDVAGEYGAIKGETEEISELYIHYRHSLISLTNIVDNDDKKSLAELHEYINGDLRRSRHDKSDKESKSSLISERRRSLPLQRSSTSLVSQYTITDTKADLTPFEVRRRRAVKLSHFFGVSYRDLFGEVLDSIEMGVREDEGKGTLNPEEAEDLLVQLRNLKTRRDEFS